MTEPNTNKQTWTYVWKTMLAGGIAGCAAKSVVAPLDRIKIMYQTNNPEFIKYQNSIKGLVQAIKYMHTNYGYKALFQGHSFTLARIFPYAAIKFMAFEQFKYLIFPSISSNRAPYAYERLLAGSLAGITSVIFTYPLEVIRVRLAYSLYPHQVQSLLYTISNEKGLGSPLFNFYRGLMPTIYGMIPYAGISFTTFDLTTQFIRHHVPWLPIHVTNLISGGFAGAISQTVAYPFEIVRRRMQIAGQFPTSAVEHIAYKSCSSTFMYIMNQQGPKGFFSGLSIGYIKVVPMSMVSFWTYALIKKRVLLID